MTCMRTWFFKILFFKILFFKTLFFMHFQKTISSYLTQTQRQHKLDDVSYNRIQNKKIISNPISRSCGCFLVSFFSLFTFLQQTTEPHFPEHLIIAINKNGVSLIKRETKVFYYYYYYYYY